MMRALAIFSTLSIISPLSGCVRYKAIIDLPDSRHVIEAKVQWRGLDNQTPQEERGREINPHWIEQDMAQVIGDAILQDFQEHSVFDRIRSQPEGALCILEGTLYRSMVRQIGLIDAVSSHGTVDAREAWVDIQLRLLQVDGQIIGKYHAQVNRLESPGIGDSIAWEFFPSEKTLNRALTEALRQLREKLLGDRERIAKVLQSDRRVLPGR